MSAGAELQAALVAALAAAAGIAGVASGVFDGPPPGAILPYLSIDGMTLDWGTKTARGREHRLAVTIWVENGLVADLHALLDAAATAIEALPAELPSNRIASCVFLREKIARDAVAPWAGLLEYRVRTLET